MRERFLAVAGWAIPLFFFVVGLVVYLPQLEYGDDDTVFDELYYFHVAENFSRGQLTHPGVFDAPGIQERFPKIPDFLFVWAERLTDNGTEVPHVPYNAEHPPLAKWMMAAMYHFSDGDPAMVRVPSALLGAAGLAGVAVLAGRLFESNVAAFLAGLLLLVEPLWYIHARLAMLEVYVAAFAIWAVALMLFPSRWAPWLSGVVAGLAVSSKYTALLVLPVLFVLARTRHFGSTRRALLATVAVPMGVLVLSALPFLFVWVHAFGVFKAVGYAAVFWVVALVWDTVGPQGHVAHSGPLEWLFLDETLRYRLAYAVNEDGVTEGLYVQTLGNLVVWWGALAFLAVALVQPLVRLWQNWRRDRTWRLAHRAAPEDRVAWRTWGIAGLLFVATWLPYLAVTRNTFLYYMTGVVPWLVVAFAGGGAWVTKRLRAERESRWLRAGAVGYGAWVVLAVALFVYWLPLFGHVATPVEAMERIWVPWWLDIRP